MVFGGNPKDAGPPKRNGINFYHCFYGKIALMSNICKAVTYTIMGSMEAAYEITIGYRLAP